MLTSIAGWNWRPQEKRFETERSKFDFRKLKFGEEHAVPFEQRSESTDNSSSVYSNASHGLKIEPSQQVVKRSSATMGSTTRGSTSDEGSERDETWKSGESGSSHLQRLAFGSVTLAGRDTEIMQLQQFYADSNVRMLTIAGPSGSGKSALANEIQSTVSLRGGVLVRGKFDVQNRADPYQAFVEVIQSFLLQMQANTTRREELSKSIHETIGEEIDILSELVPALEYFIRRKDSKNTDKTPQQGGPTSMSDRSTDRNITERAARIQNVLVEFLRLISSEEHPLTILLDDIQWAGSASLALIEEILEDSRLRNFFLLATCRDGYLKTQDDQVNEDDAAIIVDPEEKPYPQLIEVLQRYSDRAKKIDLQPLNAPSVQVVINSLLRMEDSHETLKLAEIVQQKTAGNPFFILQFMSILVTEKLLSYDLGRFKWTWLEGEIQSQNVAANVAEAVFKRLKEIESADLWALQIASTIGNSFELSTLQYVMEGLMISLGTTWKDISWPTNAQSTIDRLVDAGILEVQYGRGRYDFAHDQIQSAAFKLIPDDRKELLQLRIGRRLIDGLDVYTRDQFLFPAVELCIAGKKYMHESRRADFAFWLFLAGDMALKQGAFESALHFFEESIEALGQDPFKIDKEMAIPLYSGATEAAFATSSKKLDSYIEIVEAQKDISLVEKNRVYGILLKHLAATYKYKECNAAVSRTLNELLGEKTSPNAGLVSALIQLMKTDRMLKKYKREDLVELPICDDPKLAMALELMSAASTSLYNSNAELYCVLVCTGFRHVLKRGLTPKSPTLFTTLSVLYNAILKKVDMSIELGEAALAICKKHSYKDVFPQIVGHVFGFIHHAKRPMQQYEAPYRYAIDIGLRRGATDHVTMCMGIFCALANASASTSLRKILPEMERYGRSVRHIDDRSQLRHTLCSVQFANNLACSQNSVDPTLLSGDWMDEEKIYSFAKDNGDKITLGFFHNYKTQLLVYFHRPVEAAKHAKELFEFGVAYGQGTPFVYRMSFFVALANIQAYGKTRKRKYIRAARTMQSRLKAWIKQGNPSVPHFLSLLEAESIRTGHGKSKKDAQAAQLYQKAASMARRMGCRLDHALICELRALFFASRGDATQAADHCQEALRSYVDYGAVSKALDLESRCADLLEGLTYESILSSMNSTKLF